MVAAPPTLHWFIYSLYIRFSHSLLSAVTSSASRQSSSRLSGYFVIFVFGFKYNPNWAEQMLSRIIFQQMEYQIIYVIVIAIGWCFWPSAIVLKYNCPFLICGRSDVIDSSTLTPLIDYFSTWTFSTRSDVYNFGHNMVLLDLDQFTRFTRFICKRFHIPFTPAWCPSVPMKLSTGTYYHQ